jgi:thiaminase/transcriptional activator TenA
MTLSSDLWHAHQEVATACLEYPFVQGIAAGTLPQSCFAYYVGQDAFFLEAFARAYSIAAARSPDWEGFNAFHGLAGGVLEELKLHQAYAAGWGVDLNTIVPARATRRYTDFLLATAWSSPVGLTAAAMSPCMRLYAFLGQELAKQGILEHSYAGWIRTYSSDEFESLASQLEGLVDRYGEAMPLTSSTYHYAMQCEYDFFQAAWEIEAIS